MLLSGRQTLSSIDQALMDENEQVTSTDRRVAEAGGRLVELQQEQAREYRALARLRVEHLAGGALVVAGILVFLLSRAFRKNN